MFLFELHTGLDAEQLDLLNSLDAEMDRIQDVQLGLPEIDRCHFHVNDLDGKVALTAMWERELTVECVTVISSAFNYACGSMRMTLRRIFKVPTEEKGPEIPPRGIDN